MVKKAKLLELREMNNPNCRACSSAERKNLTDDGICTVAGSILDERNIRCVGEWAKEKIYRLIQYFGIFSAAMKNKWNLNYIEICSGPGRCVLKGTKKEIDGTALAIINHDVFKHIQAALFLDANALVVQVLNERIHSLSSEHKAQAVIGDYQNPDQIEGILRTKIPEKSLNLVFIDPTECDIPFASIEKIMMTLRNVDFIVNVAVGTDAGRNLVSAAMNPTYTKVRDKYEAFLGSPGFFKRSEILERAQHGDDESLRQLFRVEYLKRFEERGYKHTDIRRVKHYYDLLFASKESIGLNFWKKVCKYDHTLQGELPLGA